MLQDLDALTQRIQQVTQLTRNLQLERSTLLARIRQLEEECQATKDLQQREHEAFLKMSEQAARHDAEIQSVRDATSQAEVALEARLRDQHHQAESLQHQLTQVRAERDRLRETAAGAQQQIELILERLPGAEA